MEFGVGAGRDEMFMFNLPYLTKILLHSFRKKSERESNVKISSFAVEIKLISGEKCQDNRKYLKMLWFSL